MSGRSAPLIDLATLERRVTALALPAGDWALHGSAPMLAHGLLSRVHDIDIIVRGAAWTAAKRLGKMQRGLTDHCVLLPDGVEIFDGWLGDDIDTLIDTAETLDGLPFVRLEHVLAYKRRLARSHDLPHIALLESSIARR